ncbi:MAG: helix-turn-helix domain-containing protein [Deltaproteobacteria bacterium]|nr:helix-turn-helix domain-containing protein [Deltaproteobacteria bacterium]
MSLISSRKVCRFFKCKPGDLLEHVKK